MSRVVFLLEEFSMKVFLDVLIPRFFPELPFLCIPHEGKQDLEKSIPRKLKAWREPGVQFVVLRDNDGGDCHRLKATLTDLCRQGHRENTLVRIACQELEAWYFADLAAMAGEFADDGLRSLHEKERFREPDAIVCPAQALRELVPEFQKVTGARRMASRISREANRSRSFQVLMAGIDRAAAALRTAQIGGGAS